MNPWIVLGAIAAMNLITYGAFFFDKRRSMSGGWRIPEKTLLRLAFLGGSLGAKLAQAQFRHKTRKQPFARILNFIVAIHCLCLIGLAYLWVNPL